MGDLPSDSLPARFFSEARSALLEAKARIDIAPTDILTIANDAAMRAEFRQLFLRHTNDPTLNASSADIFKTSQTISKMPPRSPKSTSI